MAEKILNEVKTLTSEQLIIVDYMGMIIASTDASRINNFHEGAYRVLRTKEKLNITMQLAQKLQGVKPGINLPITFKEKIVGVIGITGRPTDVEPFAELICRMTELIIREAYYLERKEWETRGIELFFHEWIFSEHINNDFISRGTVLGVSFERPYQCILMQLEHGISEVDKIRQIENSMNHWFNQTFSKEMGDFFVRWGDGRFMLLKSHEHPMPKRKLRYELSRWQTYIEKQYDLNLVFGVGKTIQKKVIRTSYQEADKALKVAGAQGCIIFYDSLLLDLILEDITEQTRLEYINRLFAALEGEPYLLETLRVYLNHNQSSKSAAKALHIHINTMHYRMKRIKLLTGIDPKTTEGLSKFYLGLSLLEKENS